MKPVVLDTDVMSFLFKDDNRAQAYLPHSPTGDRNEWNGCACSSDAVPLFLRLAILY
jgi:hypothetical protein